MSAATPHRFTKTFVAEPHHIDELGHVNNSVWVTWVQDMATAQWETVADPAHQDQFFWVVTRHEIDYRGNIAEGEVAHGVTFIPGPAKGAQSVRHVEFTDSAGKMLVRAETTWAMLDRASGRLARVRPDVLAPFSQNAA